MPATASRDIAVLKDAAELSSSEHVLAALRATRRRTLELIAHLSTNDMERVLSPIMSPLVWDLAHIAAYEDLWLVHRHAGLDLLRADLAELYDAFETPRQKRGEIELLDTAQARVYMEEVSERSAAAIEAHGVGEGFVHEMVVRHELQHTETMRQTMALAGLLPAGEPPQTPATTAEGWIEIPAGTFQMGAGAEVFAYDNERPRHTAHTGAFQIARHPVSKASWMSFSEGGGYERREWWSDEGWAWKEEYDITHHPDAATGDSQAPVCHVSWFEADAFARAHEARLPTETEWERAATWEQGTKGTNGADPTGNRGALAGIGQVWEWTASHLGGYPGFRAYPYREYSEVFFGPDYRVLRGGSWATHPRVATTTFRNWDLPQRRQIFAGLRLTKDG
ncbi:MAG TPA: SUMF1/EgtB/PvdO family nonheme iron enzyme [Solirubrobacteraceae bacterium]|jgi:iron(II)-dependent oxidoreductase